jgi:hypothetical protein
MAMQSAAWYDHRTSTEFPYFTISHKPSTGCYYHTGSLIKGHPLLSGQISHVWRHRIAKKDHPSYYIWLPLLLNCKQGGIRRGGHCTSHNNSNNI